VEQKKVGKQGRDKKYSVYNLPKYLFHYAIMEIVNQPKTNILSHLSITKEEHCDNNSHQ